MRATAARLRGTGGCGARGRSTRNQDRYLFPIYHVQACETCWRSIRQVATHGLRESARNARKGTKRRAVQKVIALETVDGDGTPPPVELVVIDIVLKALSTQRPWPCFPPRLGLGGV